MKWLILTTTLIGLTLVFIVSSQRVPKVSTESSASALNNFKSANTFTISNPSLNLVSTHSRTAVANAQRSFTGSILDTTPTVLEYELTYTIDRDGKDSIPASAQVYVPVLDGTMPVLIYGAGTTGLADRCAPSLENPNTGSLGGYENHLLVEASQGTIAIMPDYLGFDTPDQIQFYFIAEEEAYSILSSADAFFTVEKPANLQFTANEIFIGGYSQGGHAAFASADYGKAIAPHIKIAGIIGHGPTTKITDLLQDNPNLAPYLMKSYQTYYPEFEVSNILKPDAITLLADAETKCGDEAFNYNTYTTDQMFTANFATALENNQFNGTFAKEFEYMEANNAGTVYTTIPTFIAQGTEDPIVTLEQQDIVVESLCSRGVPITYKTYEGENHFNSRQMSFIDTQEWIKAVREGKVASTC